MIQKLKNINYKKWLYTAIFSFVILSFVSVIALRFVPAVATPLMIIRSGEQLNHRTRDFRWEKDWVSMDHIYKNAIIAVVSSEDANFSKHNGFDFEAIEKAMAHNKVSKKKIGASTISQQTAKNVFLWQGRNWLRKGLEAYFTLLIELFWSKDRILEMYLNVVEFGDGIYGIEAASQHYYGKSAANLNKSEAAMLAAILPNPLKYSPINPTKYLKKRQNRIVRQMYAVTYPAVSSDVTVN
jgi:monofunctional glycosyltransferase